MCPRLSQESQLQPEDSFAQSSVREDRGSRVSVFQAIRIDSGPPPSPDSKPASGKRKETKITMRSEVGPFVLSLLCFCSSVFGQGAVEPQQGVLIFCDDPSVQSAVTSALHKFNERLSTGYKLALFQILKASKAESGSDSVYSLEFTSRRSDCPAGDSKPWTDCDYLPTGHRAPISCNATVHMTEKETDTKQVDCMIDSFLVPDRAPCLGCPEVIDETSEDLKVPLSASVSKFNSVSNSTHLFSLHRIGPATRQVVAGFRYQLMFEMKKTTCAKAEHKDLNELCVPDEENLEFANCNATVDLAPWRLELPQVQTQCEEGPLPPMTRRRPPGWSPLRNMDSPPPPGSPSAAPSLSPQTTQAPSKAPAKEESSEEDATASKPSGSPSENTHPFHCPSNPWKRFRRVHSKKLAAPTASGAAGASSKPSVEGALRDTDLLS
ncbi:kininogen-1 isoform X1 [Fundulus heteroclitus]|uniref:kininogen-1 isoform X1 n=2 Tax=Fundulus heteroclitus TaxID=8078 RepID=UPI00165C4EFD|nr:kininogen-1 isoform X1 [Fundulus heteroclitus]